MRITSAEYRFQLSAAKDAAARAELMRKIATGQIVLTDAEPPRLAPASTVEFEQQAQMDRKAQSDADRSKDYVDNFSFSLGDRADFMRKVDRASPHLRAGMLKSFDDLVKQHQK